MWIFEFSRWVCSTESQSLVRSLGYLVSNGRQVHLESIRSDRSATPACVSHWSFVFNHAYTSPRTLVLVLREPSSTGRCCLFSEKLWCPVPGELLCPVLVFWPSCVQSPNFAHLCGCAVPRIQFVLIKDVRLGKLRLACEIMMIWDGEDG
jgi:hypothetical protein